MGYRSDISILITLPEKVSAEEVIDKFRKAWDRQEADFDKYFEINQNVNGCVFLGISDVKWYEYTFEEVTNVMELVRHWDEHYESGGVHYIRLGEDYEDIEEIVSGDCEEYLSLVRYVALP